MSNKRKILLLLCLAYGVAGVAAGTLKSASRVPGLLEHAVSVAMIIGIYIWCRKDLTLRAPPRSPRWALWSALLPVFVLPAYLFRTRSTAQALKSVALGVGAYVGLVLIFVLTAAVVGIASAA